MENKSLKEEVEVLKGVINENHKGVRQDIAPLERQSDIHQMRKGSKNTVDDADEQDREGKHLRINSRNRFFCSPPNTPVSFVSKTVSLKEPFSASKPAIVIDAKSTSNDVVSLSPITKSDTGNGKQRFKSHDSSIDNVSIFTDDSMVNSSINSRTSQIDKFGIISDLNNSNGVSMNSNHNKIFSDNKRLPNNHNSTTFDCTGRTDIPNDCSRSVSPLNSRKSSNALKNTSASHSGSTINFNDRLAGTNDFASSFSRSASPLNSQGSSGLSKKSNIHSRISINSNDRPTTGNGSANNFSRPVSPLNSLRPTGVVKNFDAIETATGTNNSTNNSSRSASPLRLSSDIIPSGVNITLNQKPTITVTPSHGKPMTLNYFESETHFDSMSDSNTKSWEENPLRTPRDPSPVRGPSPSRAGLPLASIATIPQDKKMLPPSGKNVKLLNALFSNAKPTPLEVGHHFRSGSTHSANTDNEDNIDEIPSVNNSSTPDIIPVNSSNGKADKRNEVYRQPTPPSLLPTDTPAVILNKDKDKTAQTIASNYFLQQLPPPRSTSNNSGVNSTNPFNSNPLMANIIATHPSTNHSRRTSSGIPNFLSNFSPPKQSMNKSTAKGGEPVIKPPSLTPRKKQQSQQGLLLQ